MKIIFSFIFITLLLFSQTINEQIHALEDATPEKRVELMNSIKIQLIRMNEEKRMKTISALRKKLQAKTKETSVDETTHEEIKKEKKNSSHKGDKHQKEPMMMNSSHHEMQEQMMNCTHNRDAEHHQSIQEYSSEERYNQNGSWNNNPNRWGR